MTLRTVVVGFDGSEPARRAVALAAELIHGPGAELVVATAFTTRYPLGTESNVDLREEAESVAVDGVRLAEELGVDCRQRVEDGDPRYVIDAIAEAEGADLIVIGTRGRGSLARLVLGSVAAYLVGHSEIPVAVTR